MNNVIYQSLIILIFVKFHGRSVVTAISINENIEQVIGSDGLELRCNYTLVEGDTLFDVNIETTNNTANDFEVAATFRPTSSFLTMFGKSLFVNATLTNTPSTAALRFNNLTCKLERKFKCRLRTQRPEVSEDIITYSGEMNITVLVTPSKPDRIFWVEISSGALSTTPTVPMSSTTSLSSTEVTTKTISTLDSIEQNDTTASTHSTLPATNHNTSTTFTTSTTSGEDFFTNTSYRATTYNIQQTTTSHGIAEGDNITVICTGDVGKPPAEHIFQKYRSDHILSMIYTATKTSISEMSENCSYYRTSNLTYQVTAEDNLAVIRCVVNSSLAASDMYVETAPIEVYYDIPTTQSSTTCSSSCVGKKEEKSEGNFDDIPTTQSSSNCRSACVDKKEEKLQEVLGLVVGIGVAVVTVFVVIIVIIAYRRRKCKSPKFKNVSNSFDDSKPNPVPEPRAGDYDSIALDDDVTKTKSSNIGLEVEDNNKQNEEYLKKQEEEEKKKNESNTPAQPAVYAQVHESSKLKNKQKTETPEKPDKLEEDPYAESQEGVYDEAGNPRYKENKNAEQFDVSTNSSKHNSNDDNKLSIQTSQVGSYANQGFEKDENRKVATVSPTVRSSSGSQNDEQTNLNRNSQSKKEYENKIGTDQTGILEEESSHRTAL